MTVWTQACGCAFSDTHGMTLCPEAERLLARSTMLIRQCVTFLAAGKASLALEASQQEAVAAYYAHFPEDM